MSRKETNLRSSKMAILALSLLFVPMLAHSQQLCLGVDAPLEPRIGDMITVTVYLDVTSPPANSPCPTGAIPNYLGPFQCGAGDFVGVVSGVIAISHNGATQIGIRRQIDLYSADFGGVSPVHFPVGTRTLAMDLTSFDNGIEHRSILFYSPVQPAGSATGLDFLGGPIGAAGNSGALATFTYEVFHNFDQITFSIDTEKTTLEWGTNNPGSFLCSLESVFPSGTFPIIPPPLIAGPSVTVGSVEPGTRILHGKVQYYKPLDDNGVADVEVLLDTNPPTGGQVKTSSAFDGEFDFAGLALGTAYQLGGRGAFAADLYEEGVQRRDAPSDYLIAADTDLGASGLPVINGTDVADILMHWLDPDSYPLDLYKFVSPCTGDRVYPQRVAANVNAWQVSQDCRFLTGVPDPDALSITGLDAAILQQVVAARLLGSVAEMPYGYPFYANTPGLGGAGCADNWVFFDANCQLFVDADDAVDPIVYNPIGVLIGDVSPSYRNTSRTGKPAMMPGTKLVAGKVSSTEPRVTIPVELEDATDLRGLEARVLYDPTVLRFVEARAPVDPTTRGPKNHVYGKALNGTLALIVTGLTKPLQGTSTVALLEFERVDLSESRTSSPILITNGLADDMVLETENGFFTTASVEKRSWGTVKSLYR